MHTHTETHTAKQYTQKPAGGDTPAPHLLSLRDLKSVWLSPDAQNRKNISSDTNTRPRTATTQGAPDGETETLYH